MKNAFKIFPLTLALFSLIGSSCDPEEPKPPYIYELDEETLDYCYFKEGSWWVYADSMNNLFDTITCTYSEYEEFNYEYSPKKKWMIFINHLESSYLQSRIQINSFPIIIDTINYLAQINYNTAPTFKNHIVYFDAFKTDSCTWDDPNNVCYIINDRTIYRNYKQIKEFEITGPLWENLPTKLIWAPNIGIVYKEMPEGIKWELVDYHIIQ